MLEDMEALFSFENFPGNPPDSGSNCFCFPDMKSKIVGFHVLPEEKRIASTKTKEKCLLSDSKKTSELLFEPSTLHRYSTGMREMKLEYFFGENEDEPLVSAGIVPFLGPGGSREMTYLGGIHTNNSNNSSNNNNSSHGSHNSNSNSSIHNNNSNNNNNNNNHNNNNNSSHTHITHTTASLHQLSGSTHGQNQNFNYGQYVDSSSGQLSSLNSPSSHVNTNSNNSNTSYHQSHSRNTTSISSNTPSLTHTNANTNGNTHTNTNTNSNTIANTHTSINISTNNSFNSGTGLIPSNLYGSLSSPPSSTTPSTTSPHPS